MTLGLRDKVPHYEAEQQRKPFDDWGSFPLALPRGSEAATFERPMPGSFGTPGGLSARFPRLLAAKTTVNLVSQKRGNH